MSPRDLTKLVIRRPGDVYAFRYHHTDVVAYHPDGRLVIRPWDSQSTVYFARCLVPGYLQIDGSSGTRNRDAYFTVNNCRTRSEFVVDTHKQQLLTDTLEVGYRVVRISQKDGEYTALARRFIEMRALHEAVRGIKRSTYIDSSPPCAQWRAMAQRIDTEWHDVYCELEYYSNESLLTAGLILDRAIVREPIKFGEPVKRTKYSHLWKIVEDR